MNELPLHPAIVHFPIGLSILLPAIVLGFWIALVRRWIRLRAWLVISVLHLLLFGGAWTAQSTGESERRRVVFTVGSANVDPHEEWGERFVKVAFGSALVSTVPLLPLGPFVVLVGCAATLISSSATAVVGYYAGHSGGEIVYRHLVPSANP